MGWRYRRSTSFGPFRLTATQSGLGVSVGGPLGRISVNTRGQVRQTTRIPGIGLYNTRQIGTIGHGSSSTHHPSYAPVTRSSSSTSNASGPASSIPYYPMTAALPVQATRGRSIPRTILLVLGEILVAFFAMGAVASDPNLAWLLWVILGLACFIIGVTIVTGRRLKPAAAASTPMPVASVTAPAATPVTATPTAATSSKSAPVVESDVDEHIPGTISVTALDATGGELNLDPQAPGVVSVKVVGLVDPVAHLADLLALPVGADGLRHGVHEGLLIPSGAEWHVFCLAHAQDNPAMFGNQDIKTAVSVRVGRLGVRDVRTYAQLFEGHPVQIVLYIEATPGLEHLEVRFLNTPVSVDDSSSPAPDATQAAAAQPAATTASPALPAAGWFTNPENDQQWRWWDGTKWTTYTSPK